MDEKRRVFERLGTRRAIQTRGATDDFAIREDREMDNSGLAVLAWKDALDRVGGDGEYLAKTIGCLLLDFERHLGELRQAAAGQDRGLLEQVAKVIEEKASSISAQALAHAARRVAEEGGCNAAERVEFEVARLQTMVAGLPA
jgi:HPt (histidine-containing phosphotransfer) domain-containing protein